MTTIVLVQYHLQRYVKMSHPYVVLQLVQRWREQGHRVIQHYGAEDPPDGDILFLHIDLTIIPPEYRALASRYGRTVNGRNFDISKRSFSQGLVDRNSGWRGPVIVKTDRNHYGLPEQFMLELADKLGITVDIPKSIVLEEYPIFACIEDVPEYGWQLPGTIVEKFVPEMDEHGFYHVRTWHFCGDRERNVRRRATGPLVKRENTVGMTEMPVPEEIRAWRARLGFDYGKFDYVVHEGQPILLDVNRTPAGEPINTSGRPGPGRLAVLLAEGLEAFMR